MSVRIATTADAESILRIYAPAVKHTAASFELEPPSVEEMRQRISTILQKYPWLVFDRDGDVLGYAYAGEYRKRVAYQWSAEVSAYVDERARRMGIGRTLYAELFAILKRLGYFNAYAVITLPNPSSVALHESVGFKYLGVFRNVGYKLGKWHDVGWWDLVIQPHDKSPRPPISFTTI
jgi:L-amino acid N-acyltransferase YncA